MTTDTSTAEKELDLADLVDAPRSGEGGAFWEKKAGTYRLKLMGFAAGPMFKNKKKRKDDEGNEVTVEVEEGTVRWNLEVYRLGSGKRLTFTIEEGEKAGEVVEVTTDALTSRTFSKGSNMAKWLSAFLGRPLDWETLLSVPEAKAKEMQRAYMQEAIGKFAAGTFGTSKTSDKIALREVGSIDDEED